MAEKQRYTVTIGKKQYAVISDEGQESISKATNAVDTLVERILQQHADISFDKALVLAALKLAHQNDHLGNQVASYQNKGQHIAALIDEHIG